ncbi:ATP-dependent DNA helicase CHL1 [Camellia lanceoleosa]|uniref:ATP-dependent DNA helicase CHL1 n=1 Tax=Camellia lanceoleosa TaxID=1840588 RepID=A0ACC0GKX2_9ERIC|nr:ATP-dependent DNA helicase CHL1 [Camellia lanceoleosa]
MDKFSQRQRDGEDEAEAAVTGKDNENRQELDRSTLECVRLEERNMALAKELVALKLEDLAVEKNCFSRSEAASDTRSEVHRPCNKDGVSGSRSAFWTNEDWENLGVGGRIRQTKASSRCPMLRKYKLQKQFRSEIYQEGALDIEDLVLLGSRIGTCPYYGSRSEVPAADLVVIPYQSLITKSSRESLGLNLKNNIVIIDEAHNLAGSLVSMYDSKITVTAASVT